MPTVPTVSIGHGIDLLFWSQTHNRVAKCLIQQSFQLKEGKKRGLGKEYVLAAVLFQRLLSSQLETDEDVGQAPLFGVKY